MNAEILTVGTELLLGDILNSNSQFLSRELAAYGIQLLYQSTVGDNNARLKQVLSLALSRSDMVVITGGLGPTPDDLTRETVCEVLDIPLMLFVMAFLTLPPLATKNLSRWQGIVLLCIYAAFCVFQFMS